MENLVMETGCRQWFWGPKTLNLKPETRKGFGFGLNPPFGTRKGFGFGLNPPVWNPKGFRVWLNFAWVKPTYCIVHIHVYLHWWGLCWWEHPWHSAFRKGGFMFTIIIVIISVMIYIYIYTYYHYYYYYYYCYYYCYDCYDCYHCSFLFRPAGSRRSPPELYIPQRGVQWKQEVEIYMISYTSLLYDTTPIHCTPLPLHPPCNEYPLELWILTNTCLKLHRWESHCHESKPLTSSLAGSWLALDWPANAPLHPGTPNPPTNIIPTNIAWLKLSGKFPMSLGIPPLKFKIMLESNPLKSSMLVGGLGVLQ